MLPAQPTATCYVVVTSDILRVDLLGVSLGTEERGGGLSIATLALAAAILLGFSISVSMSLVGFGFT